MAVNNGQPFRLATILKRGNSTIRIGTNSKKTHPKFARRYKTGDIGYCLHAEMSVLPFSVPGDSIIVMRWLADGTLTMALPCVHCMEFLKQAKIKKITYSDWDGEFQTIRISRG